MKIHHLFTLLFGLLVATLDAQTNRLSFEWTAAPEVLVNGNPLPYGFAGGADMPQWSKVDLNRDGIEDLIAFDRQGNRWIPFLADNGSWVSAPAYADSLPKVENWALFRDFNGDGKRDLFAFVLGGIGVWENKSDSDTLLFNWALPGSFLTTDVGGFSTNLYNFSTDIPAITDIDNDGDIDILTFGQRSTVEWHEGLTTAGLNFRMNTTCWGRFEENIVSNELTLNGCQGIQKMKVSGTSGGVHAGSTLLVIDLNGDALKDALIGDVSFSNLVAAYNQGTIDSAFMTSQDSLYPSTNAVNVEFFPAAYYEDVDFDNVPDLLVSPNLNGSMNQDNVWLYKNTGSTSSPSYTNLDSSFMVSGMIDIGSGARPTLVDIDFDGDFDLVVGGTGAYLAQGTYKSKLMLFENTSATAEPTFELVDEDLADAGFNNLGEDLSPTFGDLDGDLDPDLIIGTRSGELFYYENTGTILNYNFSYRGLINGIDVGNHAAPTLGDIDGDGDLDLFIGNEAGHVAFYEKTGAYPNFFTLVEEQWAGINMASTQSPNGFATPAIVYGQDTTLLIGSRDLGVVQKDSISAILNGATSRDLVFDSGNSTSSTREETPFGGSKRNGRVQFILSPDELINAGGIYGQLESIGFELGTFSNLYLTQGFTVGMKHISDTSLTSFHTKGLTTVFNGIRVMTSGWNDISLTHPFIWNGSDPLLIEICFSKHAQTGDIPVIYHTTNFNSFLYGDVVGWNGITQDGCEMPYGGQHNKRPNVRFNLTPTLRNLDAHFMSSGSYLHPAVADINADGFPDVIVGNQSGGLHYFKGVAFKDLSLEEENLEVNISLYPNPTQHALYMNSANQKVTEGVIYSMLGQELTRITVGQNTIELPAGMYIVVFLDKQSAAVHSERLIIQ